MATWPDFLIISFKTKEFSTFLPTQSRSFIRNKPSCCPSLHYVKENSNRENLESLTANGKHQIQVENSQNWKMSRYKLCKLILIDKTGEKLTCCRRWDKREVAGGKTKKGRGGNQPLRCRFFFLLTFLCVSPYQFGFLGNCPPTPPLSQHFAPSKK